MKKEILTITSNCDGLDLSVAVIAPEDNVKGIVQFSHGMAEHKERYFGFMEWLAERGYATIINDHRGHGASVKNSDDLGYFYDETGTYVVEDLHQLTVYMKDRFPGVPVYLFGHSMGSIITRMYLKQYDGEITKMIACGAPGKNPLAGIAKVLVAVLTKLKGAKHRSQLMFNLSLGGYSKAVPNAKTPCDWLSVNEENVQEYIADPLSGFNFTLNGYKNLVGLLAGIFEETGWGVTNPDLPIFFVAGSDDPATGGIESWHNSISFLQEVGYTDVTGKLYEGLRHEILLEKDKDIVYQDVLEFIEA